MKRKYYFLILIGLITFTGICLFFFRIWQIRSDRLRQSRKAEAFIEASYAGDIDAILAIFPDSLYERLLSDTISSVDSESEIPEFVGSDLKASLETIETLFGEGWQYSFEIADRYQYTKEDLEDLNYNYEMTGVGDVGFRQASILTAEVHITGMNGTEGSQTILVPLVKTRGRWYVGQQIGSAYDELAEEGTYDIYGGLLDGFSFSYESEEPVDAEDFTVQEGADE
ncbi:MAG: hypothetical protein LUE31_02435 [Lachnospiraceae bacterium]|nr:hypothetical protein [Lachnospiraceae bacterium]